MINHLLPISKANGYIIKAILRKRLFMIHLSYHPVKKLLVGNFYLELFSVFSKVVLCCNITPLNIHQIIFYVANRIKSYL